VLIVGWITITSKKKKKKEQNKKNKIKKKKKKKIKKKKKKTRLVRLVVKHCGDCRQKEKIYVFLAFILFVKLDFYFCIFKLIKLFFNF